jgi:mono/diheme cytochrome c family protein
MASRFRKKLTGTLLVVLLLVAAGSAVYAFFHPGPWIVPEAAKHVPNPLAPSEADLPRMHALYRDKCAECHGETGRGDGNQAKMYDPAPTNLTDASRLGSETDGELFYKISEGHRPMPAFKKRLTEAQRWQLVLFIRSLGKAPAR